MQRALTLACLLWFAGSPLIAQYRTLNDRMTVPSYPTLEIWEERAKHLREHILASAGLLPLLEKTPLNPVISHSTEYDGYSISRVYFESLPGFLVTGNLYRPVSQEGPFPAIGSPHGHWAYGRLEHSSTASVPARAISLAKLGFVVFTYDMIGYNDSLQLDHDFGGARENLWGLSLGGLQLWNSIRALDFLQSLPDVDPERIGWTGASGGGTQTFLLAAADQRVKVAAPVNMISLQMQGGCLCENMPSLRLDANNVEIGALMAPRPLLMVSASGDWTRNTMKEEYSETRKIYQLYGAEDRVHGLQFDAPHNFNQDSREAVYSWMVRWLQGKPESTRIEEPRFQLPPLDVQLVFQGRALPEHALDAEGVTQTWIHHARRTLDQTPVELRAKGLLHHIGLAQLFGKNNPTSREGGAVVLLAFQDQEEAKAVAGRLEREGVNLRTIEWSPFQSETASEIRHFSAYNPTLAASRVRDVVDAVGQAEREGYGRITVVGQGEGALATLLAQLVVPIDRAILDVDGFNNSDEQAFLDRFYIPGLLRYGEFQTAVDAGQARIYIHGTENRFRVSGIEQQAEALDPDALAKLVVASD
ncbi:MAG TPA: acetylxylan esterase [Acidobacteriota bacterium]|nr:acetylxylan esterase [Acidobacteriota bacterium]